MTTPVQSRDINTRTEAEEDEGMFTISESLVESRSRKATGITVLDLDGYLERPLRIFEDLKDGCGGQVWPAGVVLAKFILSQLKDSLKDCTIIELGAGGGLVGLALAQGIPFKAPLVITDQQPMLDLMEKNIALNGLQGLVKAQVLDWGNMAQIQTCPHADIILAADCVYFEPAFPLLHQTLLAMIYEHTVCYFCFKKRRRADMQFIKMIRKSFKVEDVVDDAARQAYSKESIFL